MSRFLSGRYAAVEPYTPGEQPQDRRYVKLNTNENPFPPSPAVIETISRAEVSLLNLYSDPEAGRASAAVAAQYGLSQKNVLLGNGSDEILAFCFQAFCDENTPACFADITYGFYPVFARLYGVFSKVIPLDGDLRVNPADYYGAPGTVFIANPNAPTGIALTPGEIEDILRANPGRAVVVDEAYVDFGAQSVVKLIGKYGNLVVVQTMSKFRSLAGARIGYALADAELIADLNKMKYSFNPYNLNRLSLLAAEAAAKDTAYSEACSREIQKTRSFTAAELERRGFTVLPSSANYLFAKPNRLGGMDYYLALKEKGVLVRYLAQERILDYVRISVGTRAQMEALLRATDEIWEELK